MDKTASTDMKLNTLLKKRWSPRAFSEQEVAKQDLLLILEAARWSASCNNEQPWRFLSGIKNQDETHSKILEVLAEGNQIWAKDAPVLMLIYAKKTFSYNNKPNNWAEYDAGQAAANLSIQAMDMNIYVHQMAGFDKDAALGLISSEEDLVAVTAIALGYLGKPEQLPEKQRNWETAERTRKDLSEIILNPSEHLL